MPRKFHIPHVRELPYDILPDGLPTSAGYAAELARPAMALTGWWEFRARDVTSAPLGGLTLVSEWRSRLGAAAWRSVIADRAPQLAPDLGVSFRNTPSNLLKLEGAAFPTGARTLLFVGTTDAGEGGTSYMLGDAGEGGAARHGLYVNTVGGGSINAAVGDVVATQPSFAFGAPAWAVFAWDPGERAVFLETSAGVVAQVAATSVATAARAFMGASTSGGSGGWFGVAHAALVCSACHYSTDPTTHAARAQERETLRSYGRDVVAAIS